MPALDLSYVDAESMLSRMSAEDILELTTETLHGVNGVEEDVLEAIRYLDGDGILEADLSEAGTHIAFVLHERLMHSEALVNSYGGMQYDIPMVASDGRIPAEIEDAVLVVARYRLYGRRPVVPDDVIAEYRDTMLWLEKLSQGKVKVNLADLGTTSTSLGKSRSDFTDRTEVRFASGLF